MNINLRHQLLRPLAIAALTLLTLASTSSGQDGKNLFDRESEYYPLTSFQIPDGVELEATSFELLPDGRLAIASRRGEIWMVRDPFAKVVKAEQFSRFTHGMHEPIGLAWRDGWLYVTQRPDVSRIRDTDNDGIADQFEVVADGWEISGDYHEYAFGSKFDRDGNLWVSLCLTGSFGSDVLYRGWCVRVTPDGQTIPTVSGIRSPGGMGSDLAGEMFYTDNQGPWNGTCELKHLSPGKFVGHPGGFKWYENAEKFMGKTPKLPQSGSRFMVEADKIPEYEPPVILFPYKKMGQSASGVACDVSDGKFGPFAGQIFVGDQTLSTVMRCYLEKVDGLYQGACFPFREGIESGVVGLQMANAGSLFVGGTNRGWGSRGSKTACVERMDWSGKTPFEILEMHAIPDGFELVLTEKAEPKTANNKSSYTMETYTYIYQESYGSPEVDHTKPAITSATLSDDGYRVILKVDGLQRGHIHELHADGLQSINGKPLLHAEAYYTLNNLVK